MQNIQQILEYKFKDIALLQEALSHPSLHGELTFKGKDYERLEFLGDAVLNLIVTDILYHQFGSAVEGNLAKRRAYFISKSYIVQIAQEIGIADLMIMGSSEETSGGRQNPNNLENVLEAIIGAVYIDGGMENAFKIVSKFWNKNIQDDIIDFSDPKTVLQELLQERKLGLPKYTIISRSGPAHAPEFTIECSATDVGSEIGIGKSIKYGEKEAAIKMLKRIQDE